MKAKNIILSAALSVIMLGSCSSTNKSSETTTTKIEPAKETIIFKADSTDNAASVQISKDRSVIFTKADLGAAVFFGIFVRCI